MNGFTRLIGISMVLAISGLVARAGSDKPATRGATTTQPSGVLEPVREDTTQPADAPAEMREGTMIDLLGQIIYNAKHEAMLRFREREDSPLKTLPILPNRNLARMEAALDTAGKDAWFHVSVVATVYQNHNYLQIRDASLLLAQP